MLCLHADAAVSGATATLFKAKIH